MTFLLIALLAYAVATLSALLQTFDLPGWFTQLGPAIVYLLGLLFGVIDKARLNAGKEPMDGSSKRWLIFGVSVGLAALLVVTGGVVLPGGMPGDASDPAAVAAYMGILVTWFWGGSQGIFLFVTGLMSLATGRTTLKKPASTTGYGADPRH